MFRWFVKKVLRLYFYGRGWRYDPSVPEEVIHRSVIIAAPHTSLPDVVLTFTALELCGVYARIAIADKYARWPIRAPLEAMGAIWIDRNTASGRVSQTEAMAALYDRQQDLSIVVAAEGTRSLRTTWKTGFYHVANSAQVPICLGYLDYAKKIAGIGTYIVPTGDLQQDMQKIMQFYVNITPRHPEKFSVDTRFYP